MCSFVTVGIDPSRSAALEAALVAHRFEVSYEVNPLVARLFSVGDVLLLVTRGGCSCDLVPLTAAAARDEKRRRRGQAGASRPNQHADALFAALRAHAPVRWFFHELDGDALTAAVKDDAQLSGF